MIKLLLNFKRFYILCIIFIAAGCNAKTEDCLGPGFVSNAELAGILKSDNFSGLFDEGSSLKYFGCYKNGDKELAAYVYQREFGNHRLTQRLLFLLNSKRYLGMYEITEIPVSMKDFNIIFPFSAERGNKISLQSGEPPKEVLLDGELMEFFK